MVDGGPTLGSTIIDFIVLLNIRVGLMDKCFPLVVFMPLLQSSVIIAHMIIGIDPMLFKCWASLRRQCANIKTACFHRAMCAVIGLWEVNGVRALIGWSRACVLACSECRADDRSEWVMSARSEDCREKYSHGSVNMALTPLSQSLTQRDRPTTG